jgi:hypothetical protein
MSLRNKPAVALYFCVLIGTQAAPALAEESCAGFKWDVSRERALFGSSAQEQPAGKDAATAPCPVHALQRGYSSSLPEAQDTGQLNRWDNMWSKTVTRVHAPV